MTKVRSLDWNIAIPLAIIACGIIVTTCNAFPYIHVVPGGMNHPGGYPDFPPTEQATATDNHANVWQSFIMGGFISLSSFLVAFGILPIFLGLIKLLFRYNSGANIAISTILVMLSLIAFLFTWLTKAIILNDGGDLATFLPAAFGAMFAYAAILLIVSLDAVHKLRVLSKD